MTSSDQYDDTKRNGIQQMSKWNTADKMDSFNMLRRYVLNTIKPAIHIKYTPALPNFFDFSFMASFLFFLSFTFSFFPPDFSTAVMMTSSVFDVFAAFAKRFVKAVGSFFSFFAAGRGETN